MGNRLRLGLEFPPDLTRIHGSKGIKLYRELVGLHERSPMGSVRSVVYPFKQKLGS